MHFRNQVILALFTGSMVLPTAQAQTGELIAGRIDYLSVNNPADHWSAGVIVVAGQKAVLPKNLLIDLPANRLTLAQLFAEAPDEAPAGTSGLAWMDSNPPETRGFALLLGNRQTDGTLIVGEAVIEKGVDNLMGTVTYINHDQGYFRVDGINDNLSPIDDGTGAMVRINDPEGRHTVQRGKGTRAGSAAGPNNGSADPRFGVDPDNYTFCFSTGYPAGIPSTVVRSVVDENGALQTFTALSSSTEDELCPGSNRGTIGNTRTEEAQNATRFAPLIVGDTVTVAGNWEEIRGTRFLSAHTCQVGTKLMTDENDPSQPDYMTWAEVEWDTAGFMNERVKCLYIGFSSAANSQCFMYALDVNPLTGLNNERLIGTTVGNPQTTNVAVGPLALIGGTQMTSTESGAFKVNYDVDFPSAVLGEFDDRRNPVQNLINAGGAALQNANNGIAFNPGSATSFADQFKILAPITREMIGRTQRKLDSPNLVVTDVSGVAGAQWGEYLTPVGIGHPEMGEIDLAELDKPFCFEGQTWNHDRRCGPGGFDDSLGAPDSTATVGDLQFALTPFPHSGLDAENFAGELIQSAELSQLFTPALQARVTKTFPLGGANHVPGMSQDPVNTLATITATPGQKAGPDDGQPLRVKSATFSRDATGNGRVNVIVAAAPGQSLVAGLPGRASRMQEGMPGCYFTRFSFPSHAFSEEVVVSCLNDPTAEPCCACVHDIVMVDRALFSTSTNKLSIRACSDDCFSSPTLEAFGPDGTSLGVLVHGALDVQVYSCPAEVTVRSSTGGSDTRVTKITGRTVPFTRSRR